MLEVSMLGYGVDVGWTCRRNTSTVQVRCIKYTNEPVIMFGLGLKCVCF